jgi:polysaccharide export outer membrane protein
MILRETLKARHVRKICHALVLLIVLSLSNAFSQIPDDPVLRSRNVRYTLQRGDTVELSFPLVPAFNQSATINPDGFITLRPLGDVQVQGKTLPELTTLLRTKFSEILRESDVIVQLRDFERPYFIVGGFIERPAKYELRGETTVAQAVAIAGGFKPGAKHSQVLLFRQSTNDWVEVKDVNLKNMLSRSQLKEDLYLRNGDMIWIPQNFMSKVKPYLPTFSFSPYFNPFQH